MLNTNIQLHKEHDIDIDLPPETGENKKIPTRYANRILQGHFFISFIVGSIIEIRRHQIIVNWCLNLKLISSRTYSALRSTLVLF